MGIWTATTVSPAGGVFGGGSSVLCWHGVVRRRGQVSTISCGHAAGLYGSGLSAGSVLLSAAGRQQPLLNVGLSPFRTTGRSVLFLFAYAAAVTLSTNAVIVTNLTGAQQLTFLFTCALYAVISDPPQASPALARLFCVCSLGLIWSSGLIWLTPILQSLLDIEGREGIVTFWL